MNIEVITTGEEVLSGQITDTNASWVSQLLEERGFPVTRRTTVGDRPDDLLRAFRERAAEADCVIVNGGLGPTVDDLSAEIAARALGEPLVRHQAWVDRMEAMFARMKRKLSERNLKQAMLPASATIIDNPVGTACGFRIELEGAVVYFTPGVPHEFKRMMTEQVIPDMERVFNVETVCRLQRLHCFGIAESRLDGMLRDIDLPETVKLGFRSHIPEIEIKIMGRSEDPATLERDLDRVAEAVRQRVGANVIYEGDTSLPGRIQDLMIERGLTLTLAESCTGGMIASRLVDMAGSSQYFERGFVTYSNRAKAHDIDVPGDVIEKFGAVSAEVAQHMALGARNVAGTTHALSVTGISGPDGATEGKPVGTVAFALAAPDRLYSQLLVLPNWGRNRIRTIATTLALDMLRRQLTDLPVFGDYDYGERLSEITR